jgi:TonB family protein
MPERSRDGSRIASAGVLSVAVHGVLGVLGAAVFAGSLARGTSEIARAPELSGARAPEATIEIDLPVVVGDGTSLSDADPEEPFAPARGGGEATPRPDTGSPGRGGSDTASEPAINLADRDDGARLLPEVRSRLERSQVQRVRSAIERASREDWRASREPMELTFVASGRTGRRAERRRPAEADPSAGGRDLGAPARLGGELGASAQAAGEGHGPRRIGGAVEGRAKASQGLGVRDGSPGSDHRDSAEVALARPMVAQGTPSVPANVEGRPKDTVDGEQEVASAVPSIVHASTAGGAQGLGPGGQAGASSATGAGGVAGSGSSAKALGTGKGAGLDSSANDPRRMMYLRQVMAKVHPLWANALPRWAVLEGLQATTVIAFTIRADGSVVSASVSRPSGIPEFDENCRKAVLRGAPYPPLPPELGPSLRWAMPFEARNPAVRPRY